MKGKDYILFKHNHYLISSSESFLHSYYKRMTTSILVHMSCENVKMYSYVEQRHTHYIY